MLEGHFPYGSETGFVPVCKMELVGTLALVCCGVVISQVTHLQGPANDGCTTKYTCNYHY